jgi:cysteine synthase
MASGAANRNRLRKRQDQLLPSAIGAIGQTPLVELTRLARGRNGRIFAKLEYLNPGASKKDRIAQQLGDGALRHRVRTS